MNLKTILLSSSLFIGVNVFGAESYQCPEGSVLIDFTSQYSKERMVFCQKNHNGKIVKHGQFLVFSENGALKSKAYYNLDVVGIPEASAKEDVSVDHSKLEGILEKVIENLLNISPNRDIVIVRDPTLCPHPPMERLAFATNGTPYVNAIDFRSNCFFRGVIKYDVDKILQTTLEVQNLSDYKKLDLKYSLKRQKINDQVSISVVINEGTLSGSLAGDLKFTSESTIDFSIKKLTMSMGRSGVELKKLNIDVLQFEGKPISYKKTL